MTKSKYLLIALAAAATFFLVYLPHINYPMPFHIDEWHHISEAIRMGNYGEYFDFLKLETAYRARGLEIGFHFFLFLLSNVMDLVVVYKFFPAIWAVISALVLFFVVYKKTDKNYFVALLSMIFFASIRSNVNLTGILFFSPLTFSIPLIFLYIYFYTEGIRNQKIKPILISLLIMLILIPIHSISVLFAIPILFLYSLFHLKFLIKKIHFFSLFLLLPILGITFYKFVFKINWTELLTHLNSNWQFKYGWGVLEANNSFTETYSIAGFIMAILGIIFIIKNKEFKKYLFFILWPAIMLIWIFSYRITGISYLSPYQRNFYYFTISLPFLSGYGFYHFFKILKIYLNKLFIKSNSEKKPLISINYNFTSLQRKISLVTIFTIIFSGTVFLSFNNYFNPPKEFALYQIINEGGYQALTFLSEMPKGNVMATPFMSAAIYPVAKHYPIANLGFYGNVRDIETFFLKTDCEQKNNMISQYKISYIISPAPLECDYRIIYAQNNYIIYSVNSKDE